MKKQTWVYGKSPTPKTWHEAADVLKSLSKPKPKEKQAETQKDTK